MANQGKIGLQARVGQWVTLCFGSFIATNRQERALRVVEEAIELAQAEGLHPVYIKAIAERVYGRPVGTARAEAGGVGVTYLAYCEAFGEDHKNLIEKELARISTPKMIGKCREKQKDKVQMGVGFDAESVRRVGGGSGG
jgi:hypothetical protein